MGVIFMSMGNLVRELRRQNPQDHHQREGQFQRFAGQYMQDIHLDQWIGRQGGMVREGGREGEGGMDGGEGGMGGGEGGMVREGGEGGMVREGGRDGWRGGRDGW